VTDKHKNISVIPIVFSLTHRKLQIKDLLYFYFVCALFIIFAFRYVLQFRRETEEELKERKEDARKEIIPVTERELEFDPVPYFCGDELGFPTRPKWSSDMTREQLDNREYGYFKEYLLALKKRNDWDQLSYFELNLETWRQMWRVMEMSDILVWIADARYPVR